LDLDSALRRVSRNVESRDRFGKRETVGDEGLEVDQSSRDQSDGFGVLVGVSVLELQVDLVGRAVTEGVLWGQRLALR